MGKNKTKEQFIVDAIKVHGDKYDYRLVEYVDYRTKVKIICENCGVFEQTPANHLFGYCCKKCALIKRSFKETFIEKSNEIHNFKYEYNLVEYVNTSTKVKIICPYHNEVFEMNPASHLIGHGCPYCSGVKLHRIDFVIAANKVHNFKYDYSLVENVNHKTMIDIICNKGHIFKQSVNVHLYGHGCSTCAGLNKTTESAIHNLIGVHGDKYDYTLFEYTGVNNKSNIYCKKHNIYFEQTYASHVHGNGCPVCVGRNKTTDMVIEQFKNIHGDKYDYSLVDYIDSTSKVKIKCIFHDIVFEQLPHSHTSGDGCPICANEKNRVGNDEFIKRSNIIHNNKYDYNLVKYVNYKTHVIIICPLHGKFEQTPKSHFNKCGCPSCSGSSGEREIKMLLDKNNILYECQKTFDGCFSIAKLRFDFYLPETDMCIEFDGRQHFVLVEHFGGQKGFEVRIKNDNIKNEYCKENNIRLLRIRYDENVEEKLNEFLFSHDEK